ncbi:hypothetical protein, partial [Escherichia coli]|uniref:hypothetical protein n=1 Tax=Escherichia coli TaxID=562 RepID=UPI0006A4EB36
IVYTLHRFLVVSAYNNLKLSGLWSRLGNTFTLTQSPVSAFAADKLHVTDITRSATYPVLIDSIAVEVNSTDTAA